MYFSLSFFFYIYRSSFYLSSAFWQPLSPSFALSLAIKQCRLSSWMSIAVKQLIYNCTMLQVSSLCLPTAHPWPCLSCQGLSIVLFAQSNLYCFIIRWTNMCYCLLKNTEFIILILDIRCHLESRENTSTDYWDGLNTANVSIWCQKANTQSNWSHRSRQTNVTTALFRGE